MSVTFWGRVATTVIDSPRRVKAPMEAEEPGGAVVEYPKNAFAGVPFPRTWRDRREAKANSQTAPKSRRPVVTT